MHLPVGRRCENEAVGDGDTQSKPTSTRSITQAEGQVLKLYRAQLEAQTQIVSAAYDLLLGVADLRTGAASTAEPADILLTSVANNLRATWQLCVHGYPEQAANLAGSLYEAAYTIAALGDDQNLTNNWLTHRNPKKAFYGARKATDSGLKNLGSHSNVADAHYKLYRQLCWFKHINTVSFTEMGGKIWIGPRDSPEGIRVSKFVVQVAVQCCLVAMEAFAHFHLDSQPADELGQHLRRLDEELRSLWEAFTDEYKTCDPFPGQW